MFKQTEKQIIEAIIISLIQYENPKNFHPTFTHALLSREPEAPFI